MLTTTRSLRSLGAGLLFFAVLAGAGCGESSENDFDSTQGGEAGNGATGGTSAGAGDTAGEAGQGGSVSTGGAAGSNAGAPSGGSEPTGGQATGGNAGSTGGNASGGASGSAGSATGGTAGRNETGGSGGSSSGTGGRSPCGTVQCAEDQICVRPCCSPMNPPCLPSPMGTCPEGTRPVPYCPGSMGQGCQTNPCAAPAPYCEDVPDDCDMDLTCGCLGSLCTTGSCSQVASGIVQCVCP